MDPQQVLTWLQGLEPALGYLVLTAASVLEYLFPPFPGDTITLLGAVMVGAAGWSLPAVVASTTAGSVFGALIDYQVGRYLASTDRDTWLHRRLESETWRPRVAALCDRFRTHGPAFIIVNRFLPAIRGIFFVVAGMAGLRRGPVLAYAALSALIWNALIILLGYLVGFNLGRLVEIVRGYTNAVYVVLAVLGLAWLLWARHKRRKAGFGP